MVVIALAVGIQVVGKVMLMMGVAVMATKMIAVLGIAVIRANVMVVIRLAQTLSQMPTAKVAGHPTIPCLNPIS